MSSELKTAPKWDEFLLANYGYGIWDFTHSLVNMIQYRGYKYFYPPDTDFPKSLKFDRADWCKSFERNSKKLRTLKFRVIKVLSEYAMDWGQIDEKDSFKIKEKFITDIWDLGAFFERLDHASEWLSKTIKNLPIKILLEGKGTPIRILYRVASLWSKVMKDNEDRPQWSDIKDLLYWFSDKLKSCRYVHAFFDTTEFTEDNLKREFWINFKRGNKKKELREYFEEQRSIYFPIEKNHRRFQIEFKDQFINIDPLKDHPLLIFPDGSQFPEKTCVKLSTIN